MAKQKMPPSLEDFTLANNADLDQLALYVVDWFLRDVNAKKVRQYAISDDCEFDLFKMTSRHRAYRSNLHAWGELRAGGAARSLLTGLSINFECPEKLGEFVSFGLDNSEICRGDAITPKQEAKLIDRLKQYIRRKRN